MTSTTSTATMRARFLHVANGTSTTDTIRDAGILGATAIWADVLHDGPVPGGLSDEALLQVRARYLADTSERDGHPSYDEIVAELRRWRATIDAHDAYEELILWYEHDLFDQLNLIQVLDWIRRAQPVRQPVSLICIGSFPGRPRFKGLGELTPDELASLLDTRQRISEAQYALAERAWLAFRADDPRQIETLIGGDTSALPFLAAALRRHLEELPSTRDGLSRSERRLLQLAQSAPLDLHAAFPRMHDEETTFYIADGSFLQLARDLASAQPPLIVLDLARPLEPAAHDASAFTLTRGTVSLTETGRAVLAGTTDRVACCGLDRWFGGVHLQGREAAWRWDPGTARVVRTSIVHG